MKKLNYLTISDIHFGHPKVTAKDILEHYDNFILEHYKVLKTLDVIFVLGDVTDKPLLNGSQDHNIVTLWFTRLVMFCKKYDIELILIRGTLSHDGKGLESFSTLIKNLADIKFRYIDTISVITINNLNIVIVPDNTHKHGNDVEEYVMSNFISKGVSLDIAMVHRGFHFQMPIHLDENLNMDFWLKHIKNYIHVGHIHTPATYNRIIGQGSFDRLNQGQEEIKGAVLTYIGYNNRWIFLENAKATTFKRLHFDNISISTIVKAIKKYRENSFIEIVLPKDKLKNFDKRELLTLVKKYNIVFKNKDSNKEDKVIVSKKIKEYDLSPLNIKNLLLKRVNKHYEKDASIILEEIYVNMKC